MDISYKNTSIAPFKLESLIDDNNAMSLYKDIYNCLELIKKGDNHKLSFEFLYRSCYKLTINNYGAMLYCGILDFIIEMLVEENGCETFEEILDFWNIYEVMIDTLNDLLMYLEKNFVISNTKIPFKVVGMYIFSKYFLLSRNRIIELTNTLLNRIEQYRNSEEIENIHLTKAQLVLDKLCNIPSIEMDLKRLSTDAIDTIKYNEICCDSLTKEGCELICLKSRVPIINSSDSKILIFTFKFDNKIPTINWRDKSLFNRIFMPRFLSESRDFHRKRLNQIVHFEEDSISQIGNYLSICEKSYFIEKKLVESYLVHQIWDYLIIELDKTWIAPFFDYFDYKIFEFYSLGSKDDLQKLFRILCRVPKCLEMLKNSLKKYLTLALFKIIPNNDLFSGEKFNVFITELQEFRDRYEFIFIDCFNNYYAFNNIINLSFEDFFQERKTSILCKWIANGFDVILRSLYNDNLVDEDNNCISTLIWFFKYIIDKNYFETAYRYLLSKRLMEFTAKKRTMEHHVIIRLRSECGHGYTVKLEGILADIMQSELLNEEFQQFAKENISLASYTSIFSVITPNFWLIPPYINFPDTFEFNEKLHLFTQFFQTKYEKRKLQWHFGLGNAIVNVNLNNLNTSFKIECSTIQMFILEIFNTLDFISLGEIQDIIGIQDFNCIKKSIIGLLCEKESSILKIFSKDTWEQHQISDNLNSLSYFKSLEINTESSEYNSNIPNSSEIKATDIICINYNITLEPTSVRKYRDDLSETIPDTFINVEPDSILLQDIGHIIDSIIVKILKKNKSLHIDDIVTRVLENDSITLQGNTELIFERLSLLCQKDFISKDQYSENIYNYIP
ncbi:Cullin family protein [Cryptosporidium felis]|nr:Cullin family protein [Cryptosporidium felis]